MSLFQGCQSNPIEITYRLPIIEFRIYWIIDWIAQISHLLDNYDGFLSIIIDN